MSITIASFPKYRNRTREIGKSLESRLADHLTLVSSQFRASAVLGDAISPGAKDGPKDWTMSYARFRKGFEEIAPSLKLQPALPDVIEINSGKPVLSPFLYDYKVTDSGEQKQVRVKNGLRLVLSYPGYPFEELLHLAGAPDGRQKLHEFVLHYAVLNFVVMNNYRLLRLFEDMSLPIVTEKIDQLGKLPITTIAAPVTTGRPPDDVIAQICEISGSNLVEEVVDFEVIENDPVAQRFVRKVAPVAG